MVSNLSQTSKIFILCAALTLGCLFYDHFIRDAPLSAELFKTVHKKQIFFKSAQILETKLKDETKHNTQVMSEELSHLNAEKIKDLSVYEKSELRVNEPIQLLNIHEKMVSSGNDVQPAAPIPKSEIVSSNEKRKTVTLANICLYRDRYYFYGMDPPQREWVVKNADTGFFFGFPGEPRMYERSRHIKGNSLMLMGDFIGNNNLMHVWFGRQFTALAQGLEVHLLDKDYPFFENVIVDYSYYMRGPTAWHHGINRILLQMINEGNLKRGGPLIRVYNASETEPVCVERITVQGNGNFLTNIPVQKKPMAQSMVNEIRRIGFAHAGIKEPTRNRCPRRVLVYAKFDSTHKRWLDAEQFANLFRKEFPEMHVEYWPMMVNMGFEEQVRYFANLDIFICADGAHQMPAVFMADNSAVYETTDGTGWFLPWNYEFGLHELIKTKFRYIESIKATQEQYDEVAKVIDPGDLANHRHMDGAHVVDMEKMMADMRKLVEELRKGCVNVPLDQI
eukprot:TRINITY_DN488_c0_g1_i3.p1 TRINITY_DN488_c0_g1~~TRINITY_DN488_c0_g1_i3.p1  ORF type:complete len:506 (+),score=126.49 TRINITY_DN488_c0_g1_i3:102-1619(+)